MDADFMLRTACVAAATAVVWISAQAQGVQPAGHAKMMDNANQSAQADADFQIVPAKIGFAAPATGDQSYGEPPTARSQEGRRALGVCAGARPCAGGDIGH